MKQKLGQLILMLIALTALAGCSAWKTGKPVPIKNAPMIDDGPRLTPKIETFLTILDASSSMDEVPQTHAKFDVAKNILSRMNQMLPEYAITAGLRSFGHHSDLSPQSTRLFSGMTPYTTQGFGSALEQIKPAGGISLMEKALEAAAEDLGPMPGRTAVILLSDGKDMSPRVFPAARQLAETYGNNLCFYPILMGDDDQGRDLMTRIAGLTGCGFLTRGDQLLDNAGLNTFVHDVFFEKTAEQTATPVDSDNDGVIDSLDNCPDTPAGVAVNSTGCPLMAAENADEDDDGVADELDQCPGTPKGATVGINGCWNAGDVFFGFDESAIGPKGKTELAKVADILNRNPGLRVKLQGHTCNIGSKAYNLGLSERRAAAVKAYLVREGIAAQRLETEGVGFSMPLVPNTTSENRAMNRRTEIHPLN